MLRIAVCLMCFFILISFSQSRVFARAHVTVSHAVNKKKGKYKRRRRPVGPRLYSGVPLKIYSKKTVVISPGVQYTEEIVSRNRWRVGIIHADLTADSLHIELCKSKESASGMERVEELARRIDSTTGESVIAAVNANYWRAGTKDVLGGAVHDGEIIGFDNVKQWSRFLVFRDGTFGVEPESLSISVIPKNIPPFIVSKVNLRLSDSTITLYNHYYGASVPLPDTVTKPVTIDSLYNIASIIQHAHNPNAQSENKDTARIHYAQDTTELFYETDEDLIPLPDSLVQKPRSEQYTLKCAFIYIDSPFVNSTLRCRITGTSIHAMPIPLRGGVFTFPRADSVSFRALRIGDTISIECITTPLTSQPVKEMLMAGPRLVRSGKVSVETDQENFHKKSFINGSHARTAIGISEDQHEVVLVTVDRPMGTRKLGRPGIGLRDLARILVNESVFDAMNFDGGSSTTLVINKETVFPDTGVEFSRHVASSLCIVRSKKKKKDP